MRLRSFLCAAAVTVCLLAGAGQAHALGTARQGFGIGIGSGTIANGLSMKLMTGPGAFQGVVGFWGGGGVNDRFKHANGVAGSLDYLLEMPTIASNVYFDVAWSFGVGAGIGVPTTNSSLGAAVSGIAGLEFNFMVVPVDFVVELRPTIAVAPDVGLHLVDITASLRLWL